MDFPEEIENANLVLDHFGYWPTFHDSEIISITLMRSVDYEPAAASIRVFAFETTDKVVDGYNEQIKHCYVDIEISGLASNELEGFNHQNVVVAIEFGKTNDNLFCNLVSTYGVDGHVEGKNIRIVRLESINNPLVKA